VVRGAAITGLEGSGKTVQSRKCRRHYGTSCKRLFELGIHTKAESFICEYTGKKFAMNQMEWLIEKGEELGTSGAAHAKCPFMENFWPTKYKMTTVVLYYSEEEDAPQRKTDFVSGAFGMQG
jgi:hypothetical protein